MTGRSGGGNITAYLGSLDNRILATAPECYITSYEHIYKSIGPQCAEQNLYKMINNGLDHADFIEARAPKPTMIISTTRDFFSIQGTMESYSEAKSMYKALDAEEKLIMVEDDTVHRSTKQNREAMYAFFQKYLENPGNPLDLDIEVSDPDELRVTKTGHVVTAFDGQSVFSLNRGIVQKQLAALEVKRADFTGYLENIPSLAAKHSGFTYPDKFKKPVFSGRYVNPDYSLEKYLIPGSGDYMLPAILLKPIMKTKKEIIMIVHEEGLGYAVNEDSLAHKLIKEGYAVLLMDLPGIGSMGPGYMKGDSYINGISYNQWFATVLAGKSNVGLRAEDIVRIVHFVKNDLKEFSNVSAISIGPLGSELLHAAVFDPDINRICLIMPFLSYSNIATTRFYKPDYIPFTVAGAIEDYDLPDLMANLCPRQMLIINPLSGDGLMADETKAKNSFLFPFKVYSEKGVTGNLELINRVDKGVALDHLLSWLK